MLYGIIGIAYALLLAFLVRFFQTVHKWDEQIENMEIREETNAESTAKPKAA